MHNEKMSKQQRIRRGESNNEKGAEKKERANKRQINREAKRRKRIPCVVPLGVLKQKNTPASFSITAFGEICLTTDFDLNGLTKLKWKHFWAVWRGVFMFKEQSSLLEEEGFSSSA